MRVTGSTFTSSLVNQLNVLSARQYNLQNQATTGMRISAPSDDPAGMEEALNLQSDSSQVTQYAQNITTLQTRANTASGVLQQIQGIATRMTEITASVNGAQTPTELQADAAEVTQDIKQTVQLLNTKNGDQYIFGGTASGQPPFAVATDANGKVTGVTYQGNTSVTENDIAQNTTLAVDAPGENNTGTGPRGVVSDSRYGADLFNHMISLQNNLLAGNTDAITTTDQKNLTNDDNNMIFQVASNGATLSRLEAAAASANTQQSGLQTALTNVAGANLTDVLVQLSQAQNAYQVALQSSSNILQMQQTVLQYLP
jgi:flagellar hook-associated protein 3 FlgL